MSIETPPEAPAPDTAVPEAPAPEASLPASAPAPRIETRALPDAIVAILRALEVEKSHLLQRQQALLTGHMLTVGVESSPDWVLSNDLASVMRQVPA